MYIHKNIIPDHWRGAKFHNRGLGENFQILLFARFNFVQENVLELTDFVFFANLCFCSVILFEDRHWTILKLLGPQLLPLAEFFKTVKPLEERIAAIFFNVKPLQDRIAAIFWKAKNLLKTELLAFF